MERWEEALCQGIGPLDEQAMAQAAVRQNALTKPAGSLGRLERVALQVAGITGQARPVIRSKAIITAAGDHGVVAEGVSAYPQVVTAQMALNVLHGGAAVNVLARHVGARVLLVDAGIIATLPEHPALLSHKLGAGTGNIARGPAMSRAQAQEALQLGISAVQRERAGGLDIVGTGDLGIGNTTPSAAICAALTGADPAIVCGRGTGVDDAGLQRKIDVVGRALAVNQPDPHDALGVLASVGGFEIGVIAGTVLGAAIERIPVVVDGYISTAGAMIAVGLVPQCRDYIIPAHRSKERGHGLMLDWLQSEPLLALDMRLGEGTGAALAIGIVEAACRVLDEMSTFDEAGVAGREN
ncbi:MAG: nicotinate-nucleotide--dimethylbenzimidazole phosphoribosyltransferase [Anaerolineales bacterium]